MDTATMPPRLGPVVPDDVWPDPIALHIGRRILEARTQRGVTQQELGAAIGRTHQQIARHELVEDRVSAATLYRIADALGVSTGFFFAGMGETGPARPLDDAETREAVRALGVVHPWVRRHFLALLRAMAKEPRE